MAKVDVSTQIVIDRPCSIVSDYAMNPDNAPKWCAKIKSVEWKTPRLLRVGSRFAFMARFLGRQLEYTYEVVALSPGERLVMRTAQGPFPMETTYVFGPTNDGGTRMLLGNRGAPTGFARHLAPFIAMAVRRASRKDLARLKQVLEGHVPQR